MFFAALRDMVDPTLDGPRDDVTFAYRGSVYVRLAELQAWLTAHGENGSQAAARAVMSHYGFVRAPFTVRDAQGEVTSRSLYRSTNPTWSTSCPSGRAREWASRGPVTRRMTPSTTALPASARGG